jgi:hypothetical protein
MTTEEAIQWAGGTQVLLAEKLKINQPSVSAWGEYPPDLRQIQIERLSKGRLKAEPSAYMPKKAPVVPAKRAVA